MSFRAFKYSVSHPAFSGKVLTPGDPIELNPDLAVCNNLSVVSYEVPIIEILPNPTKGQVNIKTISSIHKVEVYNVVGKKIYSTTSDTLDLSEQKSGIYFLRIYTDAHILSKKLIKQ